MTKEQLAEAKQEALRFLKRVKILEDLIKKQNKDRPDILVFGGKETASVKRASMDLSRTLAVLRNPMS